MTVSIREIATMLKLLAMTVSIREITTGLKPFAMTSTDDIYVSKCRVLASLEHFYIPLYPPLDKGDSGLQ